MRCLLLDDEPLEIEQLELLIQRHFPNWQIEKAYNGTQAMKIIEKLEKHGATLELALVDIKISGKNGLDIAESIKERMPDLNVVVISAFQEFEYARKSLSLKAIDYLVKPVIESEFVKILTSLVEENPEYGISSEIVQKVMTIVKEQYHQPLKLAELSKGLHINANYLSRIFNEEVGMAFSDYLLHFRIEQAKNLLRKQRHWSIQRVAEECGFNSQHYFSTSFKKIMSTTPLKFRNSAG
ncbi:helix-turn-helix domain-containing protein [Bacillus sp. AFS040349]|uniref:response regulator transcription factor n=1 Tax=Bacillus sp. AFS040349 TaxID=2033502 RepID=UPI000BFE7FDC|nr:helix-turn-helix domain-containing protein [Bacillus sp. AFS040349]PGT89768.1 DNA-binding response regulator [Bacillus sp. AFS040349]